MGIAFMRLCGPLNHAEESVDMLLVGDCLILSPVSSVQGGPLHLFFTSAIWSGSNM